jgi:hypothetical protein
MKVAAFERPVRLTLVGRPELERHFPSSCEWATTRFTPVEAGGWEPAIDAVIAFAPDAVIVADPHRLPLEQLPRLPGLKLGMVVGPLPSSDDSARLERACAPACGGGFDFYTWFEEPPAEAARLPILQVFPLPLDTARCLPAPRLELRRVIVPAWARPPATCLARLRATAPVTEIPLDATATSWHDALASGGILAYWSHGTLGRLDPLPLQALADGLLVVSNTAFPEPWAVEREDEYLVRGDEESLARAVEESVKNMESLRGVRVRAWQKTREVFSADGAYQRLVHDAMLFARTRGGKALLRAVEGSPRAAPSRVAASGERRAHEHA